MMSLSGDKQADIIDAFNTTSRYLDDVLNKTNVYLTIWKSNILVEQKLAKIDR